jgi:hypothetical protein
VDSERRETCRFEILVDGYGTRRTSIRSAEKPSDLPRVARVWQLGSLDRCRKDLVHFIALILGLNQQLSHAVLTKRRRSHRI